MLKRHWWLLATTAIFAAGAANAQTPAPDLDKVDRMQRQMEQLQEQMKQVKSELVEAKKKAAESKARDTGGLQRRLWRRQAVSRQGAEHRRPRQADLGRLPGGGNRIPDPQHGLG